METEKQTLELVQTHLETDEEFAEVMTEHEQNKLLYMIIFVCTIALALNLIAW